MEIQLQPPQSIGNELSIFGKHEERAIISLAFDQPEFFSSVMSYLKDDYFEQYDTKFVYNIIKYYYETNEVIISRSMCKDVVLDELTADDPHEEIISLIERESDPREVPIITDKMMEWAKKKAMQQLYNRETIESVERGEFEDVERIMEDASKITNIGSKCYVFFNETDKLFDKNEDEKYTTAFQTLDMALNQGGPSTGEVFCWMAPTGKGKCHTLESKVIIEDLSRIFELEVEKNGETKIIRIAGFRRIQTTRGEVRVCDLLEGDDITQIPINDEGDIDL